MWCKCTGRNSTKNSVFTKLIKVVDVGFSVDFAIIIFFQCCLYSKTVL